MNDMYETGITFTAKTATAFIRCKRNGRIEKKTFRDGYCSAKSKAEDWIKEKLDFAAFYQEVFSKESD